jgi:large subunit ribosomal protein L25
MADLMLAAQKREEKGRKTNALRVEGKVPAVVYGFEVEPISLTVDRNEFERLYGQAGESTVLSLQVDGSSFDVLIQDIQRDPITGFITHGDFRKIDMSKKVETAIKLKLIGECAAVKALGGTLIQSIEEVEVLSLPNALVREIEVDIASLETFEDVVRVKDMNVPDGIEVLTDEGRSIATVQPPRSEEEMEALEAEVEDNVEDVEVTSEKEEEGGEETESAE